MTANDQPAAGQAPIDDPLNNKPLMSLVEECVNLIDELDRLRPSLEPTSQDFADHLGCRIQELLERSAVTIIAGDLTFDRHRHQTESIAGTSTDGARIEETQSPGFALGRRVFRRARVKLAVVVSTEKGPSP
jgi:molecular chaperone GrpE (heat shock protein)